MSRYAYEMNLKRLVSEIELDKSLNWMRIQEWATYVYDLDHCFEDAWYMATVSHSNAHDDNE